MRFLRIILFVSLLGGSAFFLEGGGCTGQISSGRSSVTLEGQAADEQEKPIANATVTLFKILASGTEEEVDIGAVETDSGGQYKIADIPVATCGTGEETDFYYEVRVTLGDVTTRSITAPEANATVNLSPASHLVDLLLTDVQGVSGSVLPQCEVIEGLRALGIEEVEGLKEAESLSIPALGDAGAHIVSLATGLAAAGGNTERMLNAFEAEKEGRLLKGQGTEAETATVAEYLERILRLGCDFDSDFNLPESARDEMADAFLNARTFQPAEIVNAYNANLGTGTDLTGAGLLSQLKTRLTGIEETLSDGGTIGDDDLLSLYTRRDLTSEEVDSDSELYPDQTLAILFDSLPTRCDPGDFNLIGFVSDLLGQEIVQTSSIVDLHLFNDGSDACGGTEDDPEGRLQSEVTLFTTGAVTVNGVTLTRGDNGRSKALTRTERNGPYSRWVLSQSETDASSEKNFFCIDLPQTITHRIDVDLEGAADLRETFERVHVDLPLAGLNLVDPETGSETVLSDDKSRPTSVGQKRPVLKWDPKPGTPNSSRVANAPEGSEIRFTFEFAFIDRSASSEGALTQCDQGGNALRLQTRSHILSDVDCDIAACSTASGVSSTNVVCRARVRTTLVDAYGRILNQGATVKKYFTK